MGGGPKSSPPRSHLPTLAEAEKEALLVCMSRVGDFWE